MDKKSLELRLRLPSRPLRVDIDPEFDIFRKLDHDEIPTAVSQTLGAKKMLILFPSSSDSAMLQAYREFSKMLGSAGPDSFEERLDSEVEKLPSDRTVVILGWENLFFNKAVSALSQYDVTTGQKGLRVAGKEIRRKDHSVVLTSGNPENKDMAITFIASPAEALPGLGRKLPHYHKYSYLVFEGSEPSNIIRGRWPVLHSPLTAFLPDRAGKNTWTEMGELVKRMPLALPRAFSAERMMETIGFLSGDELGGRGFGSEGLDRAAEFIAEKFREAGLEPAGDAEGSYFQVWEDKGGIPERPATMKNIVGVIRGKNPEMSGQSVVVGAHYDHLGLGWPDVREENKGKIHHGADDNASGVAVLLELAAVLARDLKPDRSIVFAAFTGEEAGKRGSRYYVGNEKRFPAQKCIGMVNLDTVGRLGRKKLLVLGAGSAREWMHIFRGAGLVTGVEMDAVSERLDSSDQTSFEEAGVPAVQLFSGPHSDYHRPGDTADKIDSEGLAKVASVAKEVVEYLSARLERMTETATKSEDHEAGSKGERKVSLGAVPDFSYSGIGCRLSGTVPGSPADTCGLKEGDVIIRMNSHDVKGLKDLSDELKSLSPGTKISITILRDGKEMTVEAEVKAR